MSDDKRQKAILGVLAALVIGAGGYYFVYSEKDAGPAQVTQKTSVRKKRATVDTTRKRVKKKREVKLEEPERTARKGRARSERTGTRKKRGRRGGPKKVVKRKFSPAA